MKRFRKRKMCNDCIYGHLLKGTAVHCEFHDKVVYESLALIHNNKCVDYRGKSTRACAPLGERT